MWTLRNRIVTIALWASALAMMASSANAGNIRNDEAKDDSVIATDERLLQAVGFVPRGKPSHGMITVLTIVDGIPARVPLHEDEGIDEGNDPDIALNASQYCPRLCIHDLKGVMCGELSADFDTTCTKDPALNPEFDIEPWNNMIRTPHPNELTGDANMDYEVNIEDLILIFNYVFKGGSEPWPHRLVADVDCNFECNEADIVLLARYLFSSDSQPIGIPGRY